MAEQGKSFEELVSEAPETQSEINVVGYLGRTSDPKKFVLTLMDGRPLTLDIDAVREHHVLSGAVGQTIVRVSLDPTWLPVDPSTLLGHVATALPHKHLVGETAAAADVKHFLQDATHVHPKRVVSDLLHKPPEADTPRGAPLLGADPTAMMVPFALATAHQLSAALMAMYSAYPGMPKWTGDYHQHLPKVVRDGSLPAYGVSDF